LLVDEPDKALFDLGVPRDGSPAACHRIGIDVMPFAMTMKVTPAFDKGTDEIATFHTSTPSSRVCAPACAGSDSLSSIIR